MDANGFLQKSGFDFQETFTPAIKSATVRIVLSFVLTHKWCLRQVDINNTFLHGDLAEEVYMALPPGFEQTSDTSHLGCKFHKALYGLNKFVFRVSIADSCLFIKSNIDVFDLLLVYVYDIVITCTSSILVDAVIQSIHAQFKLEDLGSLNYFVGIEVTSGDDYLLLNQKTYVHELLLKVGISDMTSFPLP